MIPTPAVMPRRPSAAGPTPMPVTAPTPAAAASTARRPVLRWFRAIRHASDLSPTTRLLALTLAGYASPRSGEIRDAYQPTIDGLIRATGLTSEQVHTGLRVLESHGWLHPRTRADMRFRLIHRP